MKEKTIKERGINMLETKKENKKMQKEIKGITLIALVITIIVLLILAGVSIAMLTGENGILNQATNSKEATEQAKVEEMVNVAIAGLQAENLGDNSKITPEMIAEQVNEENNRSDVTAEGSSFPTNIIFAEEGRKVEVNLSTKTGSYNGIYSEPGLEGKIAPQELFNFEPIEGTASRTKVASTEEITLPTKEARIKGIWPEFCNNDGYNPETGKNDFSDTNYEIQYEGITDTLVIPYQVEIDGEMYKVTEVDLRVYSQMYSTASPHIENIIFPNTINKLYMNGGDWEGVNNVTKKVILPANINEINSEMFKCYEALTSINIPDSVTSIGSSAFWGCTKLTSINIPDNVTSIGDSAFYNFTSLTSIELPDNITSIKRETFEKCSSLTSVKLPENLNSIDGNAFSYCSSLTNITIPSNVASIAFWSFGRCDKLILINIAKPEGSISDYETKWGATNATINWNYQG